MSHREGCWCDACTIRELRVEVERLREFIRTAALNKGVPQSVVDAALAARLAEAERLLSGCRTSFGFVNSILHESIDAFLRPADSASVVQYKPCEICTTQSWCETHGCQCYPVSAVQPERCCLDYPRCDCNSPPEPDDDWLCFRSPAQPKVTP